MLVRRACRWPSSSHLLAASKRQRGGSMEKAEIESLILPMHCPHPCWYAYMQVKGNHKTRMPPEFLQFMKDIHAMCQQNRNAIVGFSVAWREMAGGACPGTFTVRGCRFRHCRLPAFKRRMGANQCSQGAHGREKYHRRYVAFCGRFLVQCVRLPALVSAV